MKYLGFLLIGLLLIILFLLLFRFQQLGRRVSGSSRRAVLLYLIVDVFIVVNRTAGLYRFRHRLHGLRNMPMFWVSPRPHLPRQVARLDCMYIVLLHEHLNGVRHSCLAKQLKLLCRQILFNQGFHANFCQLLRCRQAGIIDAEVWLVDLYFGASLRHLFGAVENENISWISNSALELLPKTDRIRHLGDPGGVHLKRVVRKSSLGKVRLTFSLIKGSIRGNSDSPRSMASALRSSHCLFASSMSLLT